MVNWENRELPMSTQAELLSLNRTGLYYQPGAALSARSGLQASDRRNLHGPLLVRLSAHCGTVAMGRSAHQSKDGGPLYTRNGTGSGVSMRESLTT